MLALASKIKNQEDAGRAFHLRRGIGVMIYRSVASDDRSLSRADFNDIVRVPQDVKSLAAGGKIVNDRCKVFTLVAGGKRASARRLGRSPRD